jgi:hypothetical protein
MQAIVPPLGPRDSGSLVVNLQDGLLLLLERDVVRSLEPPDSPSADELADLERAATEERDRSVYGRGTRRLVQIIQLQQSLGDNLGGLVDLPTAQVLNDLLKSVGAFDEQIDLSVRGTVVTAGGQPVPGALVRAFDRDLRKEQPLGNATTGDAGTYAIRYGTAQFLTGDARDAVTPSLIVRLFVGDVQIGGDVLRPRPTADEVVDFTTPAPVTSEWERLSTALLPLLEGQSDRGAALPPREVTESDLDFLVEETGHERDYVRLWARAFALAQDVDDSAGREGTLLPETVYGWIRPGLPSTLDELVATGDELLRTTLESSLRDDLVPPSDASSIDAAVNAIHAVRVARVLKPSPAGEAPSLGDVLSTMPDPLNEDQQRVLAAAASELHPDDPQLVKAISDLPGFDGDAPAVARTLRLDALTGGHLPLVIALHPLVQSDEEGSLLPLAAVRRDQWLDLVYAHGTPAGTEVTADEYADALGTSIERQHPTAALTAHLAEGRRLGSLPSVARVGAYLRDNPTFDIVTANLDAIIDQAQPDEIDEAEQLTAALKPLQRFNVLGANWDETATLLHNDLHSPHHLLAAGLGQLAELLSEQLSSDRIMALHDKAEELHAISVGALTAALSPLSGPQVLPTQSDPLDEDLAVEGDVSLDRAAPSRAARSADPSAMKALEDVLSTGSVIDTKRALVLRGVDMAARKKAPHGSPKEKFLGGIVDQAPTLRALFGDPDGCACDHCSSVLSPAAYFVDLLQFIKNSNLDQLLLGTASVVGRRPDLQDVELSCNNTNTVVPAIDLALEVLENAVALPLRVELPAGTDVEAQLRGPAVGAAVRAALRKTVRVLPAEVSAVKEGQDWTVVDGRRRWKLTAQAEDALKSTSGQGEARALNTAGVDLPSLMLALDMGQVAAGSEGVLAEVFAPNVTRPPELANYRWTIAPVVAGQSWRVTYRIEAHLSLTERAITLGDSAGTVWWEHEYSQKAIAAIQHDLDNGVVPNVLVGILADRFAGVGALTMDAREGRSRSEGTILSESRQQMLSFHPATLNITSLAYQSGDPDADAVAEPENHNPEAYVRLNAAAVFPWSLPVDLPLDSIRLYLDRAGCSRRRLIELTNPIDQPIRDSAAFAREVLDLSAAEAGLIAPASAPTDADVYRCWGLSPATTRLFDASTGKYLSAAAPLALLQNVSILLQQSRLSFEDLQAILATRFVSQAAAAALTITPLTTCKPSEMTVTGLKTSHLDRIHRFVRLQRRLTWPVRVLDAAIPSGDALDDATAQRLAHIVLLGDLLTLPAVQLITWYDGTLSHADALRSLERALGLSPGELDHAINLFGNSDVLESPADTFEICERIRRAQRGGILFEELRFLLQHDSSPGSNVGLDETQVSALAASARGAVQSIPDASDQSAQLATRSAQENAAIAAVAAGLMADQELVAELLRGRLRHPTDVTQPAIAGFLDSSFVTTDASHPPEANAADAVKQAVNAADGRVHDILVRLYKMLRICDALALQLTDLQLVRATQQDAHGLSALDCNNLPVQHADAPANVVEYEKLLALVEMRELTPRARQASDLLHTYAALDLSDDTTSPPAAQNALADGLLIAASEVAAAAGQLRIITADEYRDPHNLLGLVEVLVTLKVQGATINEATILTGIAPNDDAAMTARSLLRAKYDESLWHDLVKPIADHLRVRQRDALVDFLVNRDHLRGADDLYERYLIDVQTGSCLKTTRLLLATAAAQLFVQRVLLNLERGLSLSPDKRALWEWMGTYRVWEANRKVFLFPENWLLPELRDDKTAIFKAMEGSLGEREPSAETTREAVQAYLDDLADLAQITVVAMYEDKRMVDGQGATQVEHRVLYVVGRTPNQPYRYYWRSCTQFGDPAMWWTGWESLDLDNANDFIMPFVFEGDLHVAWPLFKAMTDDKDKDHPIFLWEVQIAWSRRTTRGWTKRKVSNEKLVTNRLLNKTESQSFSFRLTYAGQPMTLVKDPDIESVTIECYAAAAERPDPPEVPEPVIPTTPDHFGDPVSLWVNTTLFLDPRAYGHYKIGNVDKWEHLSDVTTTVHYTLGHWGAGSESKVAQISSTTTTAITAQCGTKVDITMTRNQRPDPPPKITITLSESQNDYGAWRFEPTTVFELAESSKGDFDPTRPVIYNKAGWFTLDALHDISATSTKPEIALDTQGVSAARPVGNVLELDASGGSLPLPPGSATPVDAPAGTVKLTKAYEQSASDRAVWYGHDLTYRCYLESRSNSLNVWPDGQEFASWYRRLATASLRRLFDPATQAMQRDGQAAGSSTPSTELAVISPTISFDRSTPYANYNWELFLQVPLAIADHHMAHQRFDDARASLHAVFDPTTELKDATTRLPQYWRFLPFHNDSQPTSIAQMLTWLADPSATDPHESGFETKLTAQIEEWKHNPFMPHLVARLRPSAYQWHTFFAYLDVLIGEGDRQFRRDTRESVNEATLFYVLAAKLLGPRPRVIPPPDPPASAQTYRSLPKDSFGDLDAFSNSWVDYADLPGVKQMWLSGQGKSGTSLQIEAKAGSKSMQTADSSSGSQVLSSLGALAFCVPENEKVTEYYDLVEKRLSDVRNCRNIDGLFRDLPLYEPPIDPLLLVRARAAGLDIDSAMADTYAPLPSYRFTFSLQKALELCAEVKSLGSALLAALDRKDAEELSLLRAGHEVALLRLARDVRKQQVEEAEANITALKQSSETVLMRFSQYQKLLGKTTLSKDPDGLPVVDQASTLTVSTDAPGELSSLGLSRREVDQLIYTAGANAFTQAANAANILAAIFNLIPNITAGSPFAGQTFGGSNMGSATSAIAKAIEMGAVQSNFLAGQAGAFGSYERRQDDWVHQSKLALGELKQIEKQIIAAEIRKAIAEQELEHHDAQIDNAQQAADLLHDRFTNQQLYRWMSAQIAQVYFRTYQLALDQARRVERAYQHELGLGASSTPYVRSGQWDSLKRGLLAGEQLHQDLKRMESAFLERNVREFEITKHISLLQLNPGKLLQLKETGSCDFNIPEMLFDIDFPGHYMRRIKMVSLSIPCVVGPYASVNATLRLTKNSIRVAPTATPAVPYATAGDEDTRFRATHAAVDAIVTSTAQQDSGMFEPSLRDERYLPFEGSGVISSWTLDLPQDWQPFNYATIADVILHVRYTARDGGHELKSKAVEAVEGAVAVAAESGFARLVSLRQEFPGNWSQFLNPPDTATEQTLQFELTQDRLNLGFKNRTVQVNQVDVYLKFSSITNKATFHRDVQNPTPMGDYQQAAALGLDLTPPDPTPQLNSTPTPGIQWPPVMALESDSHLNGLPHAITNFVRDFDGPGAPGTWSLSFSDADIEAIASSLRFKVTVDNQDHWRLRSDLIDDIVVLVHYSLG